MATLGEIDKIAQNIAHGQLKVVKVLYVIAFSVEPPPRRARKDLKDFSGYQLPVESEQFENKVREVVQLYVSSDLVAVCNILDLEYQGNVDSVANRICSFLNDPKENDTSSAYRDEEEEENTENEEHDEDDTKSVTMKLISFALTFRDIEDSIRSYDSTHGYPIEKWIQDFEEIAEITQWNDLQKLIFAKKSLSGLARLFVQSQKGIRSWVTLKKKLLQEFEQKISSSQVHKELISRKKKKR